MFRAVHWPGIQPRCGDKKKTGDLHMTPLVKRLTDVAIVMAISAGIAFAIIAAANSLAAKMTLWRSYNLWLALITRPDIIATTLLAILVTMAVATYQQRHGKR